MVTREPFGVPIDVTSRESLVGAAGQTITNKKFKIVKSVQMREDAELFHRVLRLCVERFDCSRLELAKTFECSTSTVRHWLDGTVAPTPGVRQYVYAHFIDRLCREPRP